MNPLVTNQLVLSNREKEVLHLILEEYSSSKIAAEIGLSIRTVETHRKHILKKTGVKSTIGLVKLAISMGWMNDYYYRPNRQKRKKLLPFNL
jgi:DNA-binding CsgD family transcriptional regulator